MIEKKVVFISGMPRAMTTLMCNILANNPNIGGGETSPMLEYLFGARLNYSTVPEVKSALTEDLMRESYLKYCYWGMQGYANSITNKSIYLDKSRGWVYFYPFVKKFYPNAKLILMVRDLRSIVSSFEKKWRQYPEIQDMRENHETQAFINISSRINYFLQNKPVSLALDRIGDAINIGTIKDMLVIKAEDLTMNTEATMKKVYEYINEPYCELDYSNIKQVTVENDRISDFGIYGDHKIRTDIKPLERDFIEVLGKEACNAIKQNYGWYFDIFKYY